MADGAKLADMPLYTNLDRVERGLAAHGVAPGDSTRAMMDVTKSTVGRSWRQV